MTEPAHNHQAKEHVYYITKGRGEILLGDEIYEVRDGAPPHIFPNALSTASSTMATTGYSTSY